MAAWQQRFAACESLRLGVNVSGKQFAESDLVNNVQKILDNAGLSPKTLTIEVTESTTMSNHVEVSERLATLRNRGVRVAIDDFGTGYSSLAVLHHLPLDILKIDRSFVGRMLDSPQNRAIVRTILSLADSLNLNVIAEGVESAEQRLELLSLGCVHGQGFYFSEPLDVEEVEQLFAQEQNAENGIVLADL